MSDPYTYPGTDVLRNKEDIRDPNELEAFERIATASRLETLPEAIPITYDGYCEIHRYIFQDVYDWAGKTRIVDLAKDNALFCLARFVEPELKKRFEAIGAEGDLRNLDAARFTIRAAHHLSELNAIHPFRDGNGRTQRAFLSLLGRQAGHEIDLGRIDPQSWINASKEGFQTGSSRAVQDVIARAIEPL